MSCIRRIIYKFLNIKKLKKNTKNTPKILKIKGINFNKKLLYSKSECKLCITLKSFKIMELSKKLFPGPIIRSKKK
jgi:hypothetical protein